MWSSFIAVYSRLHGFPHSAEITTRSALLPGPPGMKHAHRSLIMLVNLSISLAISLPSWEKNITHLSVLRGFPGGSAVESAYSAGDGDEGSTPGPGRSPGGRNGTPLQYSCLGNPMDRGAWRATSLGGKESGKHTNL